jgi:hypothetical protein
MPGLRALPFAIAVAAVGCTNDAGHRPTARIALCPEFVPIGDGYRTDVHLDGTASSDPLNDPDALVPLAFRWTIDDPAPQVAAGSLDGPLVTVRIAGARPTEAALTVTNAAGASGTAAVEIGVTLPDDAGLGTSPCKN